MPSRLKIMLLRFYLKLRELIDLRKDFDEAGTAEFIIANTEFKSANAWSLIFAIFIASIGLLVNSTAVIIGAMLISPLMGPIIGAGYALGVRDFEVLKKSILNLSYAVVISLIASTLLFSLSPTPFEQSELLSRTHPTFFDVMIAFFGGAAGIVAISRKHKGNAVPGVAIATALMPPLCTAGYGLSHLNFGFFLGALYLFLINTAFILISTYLFVRYLRFKETPGTSERHSLLIRKWLSWSSVILVIPSLIMAWYLQRKSSFENKSEFFLKNEFAYSSTLIANREIFFQLTAPIIRIRTFGAELSASKIQELTAKIPKYLPPDTRLEVTPLYGDAPTTSELAEKFVSKTDFLKFINEQPLPKSPPKSPAVWPSLKAQLPSYVSDVNVMSEETTLNKVNVIWSRKPSRAQRSSAEKILSLKLVGPCEFTHGMRLPL